MPTIVEIRQRGGSERINCKCFATMSVVGVEIMGMSMSRTWLPKIGLEAIRFIWRRLQRATRIFRSGFWLVDCAEFG